MRTILHYVSAIALSLSCLSNAWADNALKVVTTLSTYADIAKSIGGDRVDVRYVAPPRFNPHFIEPRPSDVLKVKNSELFIHSGLDLEAWRGPLIDAAARSDLRQSGERQLDLSPGIALLEVPDHGVSRAEGDIHLFGNPHYWLDPRNGVIIAKEIAAKLSSVDPHHRNDYERNLLVFTSALEGKMSEWSKRLEPYRGQEFIGYHNEWIYLMQFADLQMKNFLEPKPGIPPTPQQLEFITSYIKEHSVRAIIQASFNPEEAARTVAGRTGVAVLTLCQNVGELPEAASYSSMLDSNISKIIEALQRG